ncbi:erythromycin esterase family protein [Haloarchaeobius sp. DFWS5]|uniref:erythromycin esterase family protein n=1 Tax=Haloarchaeobius sp. DFWS5 TaxID=3446114 RepID=UPI003EBB4176
MTQDSHCDELMHSLRTQAIDLGEQGVVTDTDDQPDRLTAFADIDIVGMGEATHRTSEFFRVKHRVFEHLVREHGFRLFGLEAQFAEALALHDYVVHGIGDLESALDELVLTIYDTEEMGSLLRWMRAFNEDQPLSDRIAVYGFDVQSPSGAAAALREYVDEHDVGSEVDDLVASLTTLADGIVDGYDVETDRLQMAAQVVQRLDEHFEADADCPGQPRSPGLDPTLAKQLVWTLQWGCEFARAGMETDRNTQHGVRDRYMAGTVEWIRQYESRAQIALWAHNNHVKTGELCGIKGDAETMGDRLARQYGDRYYALGLQFGDGTIRGLMTVSSEGAFEFDGQQYSRQEMEVPEAPADAVPSLFAHVDTSTAFLDYRSLADTSHLRAWLDEPRPHYFVAGIVDPADETTVLEPHNAITEFDGMVFVRDASPTTPR